MCLKMSINPGLIFEILRYIKKRHDDDSELEIMVYLNEHHSSRFYANHASVRFHYLSTFTSCISQIIGISISIVSVSSFVNKLTLNWLELDDIANYITSDTFVTTSPEIY